MILIFLDEAGYNKNWEDNIKEQPFYVLSAVCIDSKSYSKSCLEIRKEIQKLNIPNIGSDIGLGKGYWQKHNPERNKVRDLMLSYPSRYGGTAFVVVIDKQCHKDQYRSPGEPSLLSLNIICERLQHYLRSKKEYGIIIYDLNQIIMNDLLDYTSFLIREGSIVNYIWVITMDIDRICEFTFGNSLYSIGLQVADFFATLTYHYKKEGEPKDCEWWDTLYKSLHSRYGKKKGIGFKEFP